MNKKWEYYDINTKEVEEIKNKYNVSRLVATVISNKKLQDDIDVFLNPTRNDFYDPFLMPDMEIAVNRIIKAIGNQEKVIIYGKQFFDFYYNNISGTVFSAADWLVLVDFSAEEADR